MKIIRDTWLVYRRALTERLRVPAFVFVSLAQPLLYLFFFGPLLKAAGVGRGTPGGAYNLLVPGLLVLMAYFVGGGAGFGLIEEMAAGVIERFQVTPISRTALVLGRAARDVTFLAAQCTGLLLVARPVGLRPDWTGAALAILLVCALGLALSALSNAVALGMGDATGFAALFNGLAIVVLLLSGVLLPLSLGPAWLRGVAGADPLRYTVDASRELVNGDLTGTTSLVGIGVTAAFTLLAIGWSVHRFRRRVG